MRFYFYHHSFLTGGTVLVAHPKGYPPTPRGPEGWEPMPADLADKVREAMAHNPEHIRNRYVWIYDPELTTLIGQFELR